ncbi:hypothetical protein DRO02_02935 [archaeon]|nr:MAG: hypothetical protein DRO21_03880 [archaeon]RLG65011.1 MAG: hypothetical protein DRO02_02935 [archaeon]HDM24229.1 hypothetical protein [Candidatus Bathyarchaeota archaeon]
MQELYRKLEGKIAIIGETGTGKTRLTLKAIEKLAEKHGENLTVIDFAPGKTFYKGKTIGLRIEDILPIEILNKIRYIKANTKPARITSKTCKQLMETVKENTRECLQALGKFIKNPTGHLVINDLSIYLQGGSLQPLLKCMKLANTMIVNSYYGYSISGPTECHLLISRRERFMVRCILRMFDRVVKL